MIGLAIYPAIMRSSVLFAIGTAVLYGVFSILYFFIPDKTLIAAYSAVFVKVVIAAIHLVTPSEGASAIGNTLQSSRTAFEVVRGCDGFGATFLFISAVISSRGSFILKFVGIALFSLAMYTLNLIRIFVLYYISAYRSHWFVFAHTYFAPALIVMVGCGLFILWLELVNKAYVTNPP